MKRKSKQWIIISENMVNMNLLITNKKESWPFCWFQPQVSCLNSIIFRVIGILALPDLRHAMSNAKQPAWNRPMRPMPTWPRQSPTGQSSAESDSDDWFYWTSYFWQEIQVAIYLLNFYLSNVVLLVNYILYRAQCF